MCQSVRAQDSKINSKRGGKQEKMVMSMEVLKSEVCEKEDSLHSADSRLQVAD
jgi:hypothetical protein